MKKVRVWYRRTGYSDLQTHVESFSNYEAFLITHERIHDYSTTDGLEGIWRRFTQTSHPRAMAFGDVIEMIEDNRFYVSIPLGFALLSFTAPLPLEITQASDVPDVITQASDVPEVITHASDVPDITHPVSNDPEVAAILDSLKFEGEEEEGVEGVEERHIEMELETPILERRRHLDEIYINLFDEKSDKIHSICFTDLTELERAAQLAAVPPSELIPICLRLATSLRELGDALNISGHPFRYDEQDYLLDTDDGKREAPPSRLPEQLITIMVKEWKLDEMDLQRKLLIVECESSMQGSNPALTLISHWVCLQESLLKSANSFYEALLKTRISPAVCYRLNQIHLQVDDAEILWHKEPVRLLLRSILLLYPSLENNNSHSMGANCL